MKIFVYAAATGKRQHEGKAASVVSGTWRAGPDLRSHRAEGCLRSSFPACCTLTRADPPAREQRSSFCSLRRAAASQWNCKVREGALRPRPPRPGEASSWWGPPPCARSCSGGPVCGFSLDLHPGHKRKEHEHLREREEAQL